MKSKTSLIWRYFVEIDDEKARCILCDKLYSRKGRTTTALKSHIKAIHAEEFAEFEKLSEAAKLSSETKKEKDYNETAPMDPHQPATPEAYPIQQNVNVEDRSIQSGRKFVSTINQSNMFESKNSKYIETEFTDIKKQVVETLNHLKKAVKYNRELDEYDLYGQLLAKKLRKLDERQRDVAMHEIDNIMFRAKMERPTTPQGQPSETISPIFIVTQPNQQQYEDENPL